jgi:ubiquinone biosynthesis monooxygenase Coq7
MFDTLITEFDKGLRTLFAPAQSQRPRPDAGLEEAELSTEKSVMPSA